MYKIENRKQTRYLTYCVPKGLYCTQVPLFLFEEKQDKNQFRPIESTMKSLTKIFRKRFVQLFYFGVKGLKYC